jgi:rRNA-processing protein FCF1
MFVGYPQWGWGLSDNSLEAARMELLKQVRDWGPRFRLLYRHPTPTVSKRLDDNLGLLERWLVRGHGDHSIPSTIDRAADLVSTAVNDLRSLGDLIPVDPYQIRVVPDTNTLIDNPDLAVHTGTLGPRYMVHLLPVVFGELDDLRRAGKTPELREAAQRADKRLKGSRVNGNVQTGTRVTGNVFIVFEYTEPRNEGLPSWLDLTVPDDRFVAATLLLQSAHPGSAVYVATGDLNMQNKLAAIGLPFVELP